LNLSRARQSAGEFAEIYRRHNLTGAHVIKLGPGNDAAAKEALAAWPGPVLDPLRVPEIEIVLQEVFKLEAG